MNRFFAAAALAAIAVWLGSCATKPEIPYDRGSASIHTIGIITPAFPDGPSVALASTVGQSFGLRPAFRPICLIGRSA